MFVSIKPYILVVVGLPVLKPSASFGFNMFYSGCQQTLIELVKPQPIVTTVAFYSFGEGLYVGYYDYTHTLDYCLKSQSLHAPVINYEAFPLIHAPRLRLGVENQLDDEMVK